MRSIIITSAVLVALGLSASAPASATDASVNRRAIVIPAQPLSTALETLGRERDLQILYRSEVVGGLHAKPVSGELTVDEALNLLLRDTGLTSQYIDTKTVMITRAQTTTSTDNVNHSVPAAREVSLDSESSTATSAAGSRNFIHLAQAPAAPASAPERASTPAAPSSEEIIVTGSRIERAVDDASLPVTVLTSEDIALSGESRVAEVISRLPYNSQGPSITGSGSAGSTAQASQDVNLRGLGYGRTLTLLNGRRLPPDGAAFAFSTNLNFIPTAAVERIEVLRSGGSPVYGSDALGGVVNIVLKKDFEGGIVSAQYGDSSSTNTSELSINGTFGANSERGNVLVSLESRKLDPLRTADVNALLPDRANLGTGFTSNGFPITFTVRNIFGDGTNINSPSIAAANCDPSLIRRTAGVTRVNPVTSATISYANTTECRQDVETATDFTAETDLRSIFTTASYDITDDFSVFADVLVADYDTTSRLTSGTLSGLTMAATNPNNPTFNATPTNPIHGVTGPRTIAFNMTAPVPFHVELNTKQLLAAAGFDWSTSHGRLSGYYHWAESESEQRSLNTYSIAAIQNAINSGALNPFAAPGNSANVFNSASGIFIRQPTGRVKTANLSWSGKLPLTLPGGNILYSVGAENREESYVETGQGSGFAQGFNAGFFLATNNERNVDSAFAEFVFPLLSALELNYAGRWDSYDLPDFSELSHRLGVQWRALPSTTLRASYTQGIAAPNLFFVSGNTSQTISSVIDTRQCQQAGNNAADPRCQPVLVQQTLKGGADLGPETADNYTVGVVWSGVPGLTLALDLWRVEVDDQVGNLANQVVVNLEAAGANLADFGVSLERDAAGNIVSLTSGSANIPGFKTDGFDFEARWRQELSSWGRFSSSALLTWVNSFERPIAPGSPVLDAVGFLGTPEFKANWSNSLEVGPILGNVTLNFVDGFDGRTPEATHINNVAPFGEIDSFFTVDASVTWNSPWNTRFYVGARNLFDEQPTVNRAIYAANGFDVANSNILGRVLVLRLTHEF